MMFGGPYSRFEGDEGVVEEEVLVADARLLQIAQASSGSGAAARAAARAARVAACAAADAAANRRGP